MKRHSHGKSKEKPTVEWVAIHNSTLTLLKEVQEENASLKERIAILENEKLEVKEATENFFENKKKKVLVTGDSHLKMISFENLQRHTGHNITKIPSYCSRSDWPGAFYPKSSLVSALKDNVDDSITHVIMTAPISDLTNVRDCERGTRSIFADLSAKSIISTAEWALINYPALQHVYILEHLPRYARIWNQISF